MADKELYGDLPILSQKIRERRGRFAGHCFRNRIKPVSRLIHWIPKHGRRKPGRPPKASHMYCPEARYWTGDIGGTDSNAGQKALEGHSSSRTPLDLSQVKKDRKNHSVHILFT